MHQYTSYAVICHCSNAFTDAKSQRSSGRCCVPVFFSRYEWKSMERGLECKYIINTVFSNPFHHASYIYDSSQMTRSTMDFQVRVLHKSIGNFKLINYPPKLITFSILFVLVCCCVCSIDNMQLRRLLQMLLQVFVFYFSHFPPFWICHLSIEHFSSY